MIRGVDIYPKTQLALIPRYYPIGTTNIYLVKLELEFRRTEIKLEA